jgi:ribosomal protein S10
MAQTVASIRLQSRRSISLDTLLDKIVEIVLSFDQHESTAIKANREQ